MIMLKKKLSDYKVILASGSPRRQNLLQQMGIEFDVKIAEVDEALPNDIPWQESAGYLARLKSNWFREKDLPPNYLLITADTVVCAHEKVLGKPVDVQDAMDIIGALSGAEHDVITGVCLRTATKQFSFSASTRVCFRVLHEDEIQHYVNVYRPFDKAGAYGIQEWIGLVGVESISGSFYNVMGLPTQKLYCELLNFAGR
jgi:septum formation protein